MSFILDALKKSESDRQRQSGPALFEVKIAPPKARFPAWAIAVAGLLVINMAIVGWLLMRRTSHADEATTGTNGPVTTSNAFVSTSNTTPAQAAGNAGLVTTVPAAASGNAGLSAAQPAAAQVPGNTAQVPVSTLQAPDNAAPAPGNTDSESSGPTLAGANAQAGANNDSSAVPGGNPDDYAPATEPGANSPFKGHVRRGTDSGYMLYQDAAVAPGANLPQLRLDLHVYAAKPQDRFALINMHKLREGDSLPDGVRVESITPEGVVMSHNGAKFFLPRD